MITLKAADHVHGRQLPFSPLVSLLIAFAALVSPLHSVLSTQYSVLGAQEAPALLLGVGDSLMAGVGASLPDERGEFALVADLMRGRYRAESASRQCRCSRRDERDPARTRRHRPPAAAGEPTPTPTRPQILRALDELGRLPQGQQAVVLLSIGGNDLQRLAGKDTAAREAALATFRTNLTTILTRLLEGGQTRTLLIQTIYDPFGGDPTAVEQRRVVDRAVQRRYPRGRGGEAGCDRRRIGGKGARQGAIADPRAASMMCISPMRVTA